MVAQKNKNEIIEDDTVIVYDLSKIRDRIETWKQKLGRIEPFYAVKCNTEPEILTCMKGFGMNFDCASRKEIEIALSIGAEPSSIIYANPCKQISHIKYANKVGVKLTTFDSLSELDKIAEYAPTMELLLRLATDDSKAICTMSEKYGASITEVDTLLSRARELNLNVIGFAFHVGSASEDPLAFSKAILLTKKAMDIASANNFETKVIDIGGGFPGQTGTLFNQLVHDLNGALDSYLSDDSDLRIIAEPGRYFVSSCATLHCPVIGYKELQTGHRRYFLSDGVYGVLSCIIYDHAKVIPKVTPKSGSKEEVESSLWGPSCDGFDCILKRVNLPKLEIGDVVSFEELGAYSIVSATNFNGLCNPVKRFLGDKKV